jgi:hypothetical protein
MQIGAAEKCRFGQVVQSDWPFIELFSLSY